MKATIEIEIPSGVILGDDSKEAVAKELQALLATADKPIELLSVVKVRADPVWQVWKREGHNPSGDWLVCDVLSSYIPASALLDEVAFEPGLRELTCLTANDAEFFLAKEGSPVGNTSVIRHMNDRSYDPMIVEVYIPDRGPVNLDLTSFLFNDDGDKIEEMAARGWEMNSADLGAALLATSLHPRKKYPISTEAFGNHTLMDHQDCFTAEIFHDKDSFISYLIETKGHKVAATINPESLEAWLRQNRSELQYPDTQGLRK